MRLLLASLSAVALACPALADSCEPPPVPGDWELVLNEEFEGDRLDDSLWTRNPVWEGGLGGAGFASENAYVRDGQLNILTEATPITTPNGESYEYSSGLIHSMGKFTQKYGYFEAKFTQPTAYGNGLWTAFWLMPDRVGDGLRKWWDGRRSTHDLGRDGVGYDGKGMEIDIMEQLSKWGSNTSSFAAHWDGYGEDHQFESHRVTVPDKPDAATRVYGLHWSPGSLVYYVDGQEVGRIESERVADVPMFLKLNTTVGGWDGNRIDADTKLPAVTTVDWVRVWQKGNAASEAAAGCR